MSKWDGKKIATMEWVGLKYERDHLELLQRITEKFD